MKSKESLFRDFGIERGQGHGILVEPRTNKFLMVDREVLRVAGRATQMNEVGIKRRWCWWWHWSRVQEKREKRKKGREDSREREGVVLFGKFARCLASDSRIRFHGAVGTLGLSRSSTFHLVGTKCLSFAKRTERIPRVQLLWIFCTNGFNLLNFQSKYTCMKYEVTKLKSCSCWKELELQNLS